VPLQSQPLRDLYGWRTASKVALSDLQQYDPTGTLFVSNWSLASRMAWYSNHPVQIIGEHGTTQFTLWFGEPQQGAHGILIVPFGTQEPAATGNAPDQFKNCTLLHTVMIMSDEKLVNTFGFYQCKDYQQN
jgi:hypothetical protein